jgi:UDP-glucose 4-epimerase
MDWKVATGGARGQAVDAQRLVVVGHTGFIGHYLVPELAAAAPGSEVVGASTPDLDLTSQSGAAALLPLLGPNTTVVFLAGVKRQLGDTIESFETNIVIATNFCRCLQQQRIRRVVYVSSAAVYGEENHNLAITEDTPVRPTSLYGAAKFASECLVVKTLRDAGRGSLAVVRPPLVYGPGDTSVSYGPSGFANAAMLRMPVTLWGDGTERREFLFVRDAAKLIASLAVAEHEGLFNLASGESHSYIDVLDEMRNALGREIPTTMRPRTKPKVDHGFQNAALRRLFPDFRFTPLSEGVRETLESRGAAS